MDFGAFVDVGLHDNCLLHKKWFTPTDGIAIGASVELVVESVDVARGRLSVKLDRDDLTQHNPSNRQAGRDGSALGAASTKRPREGGDNAVVRSQPLAKTGSGAGEGSSSSRDDHRPKKPRTRT